MSRRIYLDGAAAAPVRVRSLRAFRRAQHIYGNPSAPHEEGRAAKAILEEARATIAHLAGVKPEGVIFTSGGTEANALAIHGHVRAHIEKGKDYEQLHLLYNAGAHASIREAMLAEATRGAVVEEIPFKDGALDLEAVRRLIRKETTLISLEAVSSETGIRLDTRAVRTLVDQLRKEEKIYLHVDACQLPLVESFERTRLAGDMVSLDAQKVGGVRGIGCLVSAPLVPLVPIIHGGGQERGLRSGTESPGLALAFASALDECTKTRDLFVKRARTFRTYLIERITTEMGDTVINEGLHNVPHILNITCIGRDTDYVVALLDERGFAVSTRSSCESDSVEGSRGVLALTEDTARATATLRISFTIHTTMTDVKKFFRALQDIISFLDRNRP